MSGNEFYDLIILGGGPAGLTAGIYAMRAALKTVLVERGVPGGQVAITKEVENYAGFIEIGGFDLCDKFFQHAKHYGLEMIEKEAVCTEPGLDYHSVRIADGTLLKAHAVVLAAGGTARKLNIPGEDEYFGKGVSYCATCDGFFFRDKTVAVVGGGDTALEDVLYLFVGFAPNNQLVPAGIKTNRTGYVITDEKCETDIPGIFAVGDLRQKYANQIVLAAADGCTAALAAAHYVETRKGGQTCQDDGSSHEQNAKQVSQ